MSGTIAIPQSYALATSLGDSPKSQSVGSFQRADPAASLLSGAFPQSAGSVAIPQRGPSPSWSAGTWRQQLQPGSWKGVGFVLDAAEMRAGRRLAVHEYPYRDDSWVEDLGKLPRRFAIHAYLTGDDVYQQRDAMVRVCEEAGPGTLVHPTMGSLQCVLMEFATIDRRERGRYVEIALSFMIAGDPQYPAASQSGIATITAKATRLGDAIPQDLSATLDKVQSVPKASLDTIQPYTDAAKSTTGDASRVFGCVTGLPGYNGRFALGNMQSFQSPVNTVQTAISQATTARTTVFASADHLMTTVQAL